MRKITVFTPTYNRGYILDKLYNSLIVQTSKNFKWIIIDDGSDDNTKEMVESWIVENKIEIEYKYQKNQGKSMAHNEGVRMADTELFICVDSDDWLVEEAIEEILESWEIARDNRECIGIIFYKINKDGKPIAGKYMPTKIKYATMEDVYERYGYKGDAGIVLKTQLLKQNLFPKIDGEKFVPESYIYDRFDQIGKVFVLNEGLYACEYLDDGYTKNIAKLIAKNPKGYSMYARQKMEFTKKIHVKIKSMARYIVGCWLAKQKIILDNFLEHCIYVLAFPAAIGLYILKYARRR